MGLLRQQVTEALGCDKARELMLRFGYQNGYADFMQMRVNYTFDTEQDLLAAGPVHRCVGQLLRGDAVPVLQRPR